MPRKKWVAQTDITPELLKAREKRKWQIAFRRYVIEQKPSAHYAHYFGLDIAHLRQWLQIQLPANVGWGDFGSKWQFDHVVPVTCFDFDQEEELILCWNFINMRIKEITGQDTGSWLDLVWAKTYFTKLHEATQYPLCKQLLQKITTLERLDIADTTPQVDFIKSNRAYLDALAGYSAFEFDLLNNGRTPDEVNQEVSFLKKF